MNKREFSMIVRRNEWGTAITVSELAHESHCPISLIEGLAELGVIEAVGRSGAEMLFDLSSVRRLKRGLRLKHDLGIEAKDLALVLDLLERIDDLEEELQRKSNA